MRHVLYGGWLSHARHRSARVASPLHQHRLLTIAPCELGSRRISNPRVLAEFRERRLNQGCLFSVLYFWLFRDFYFCVLSGFLSFVSIGKAVDSRDHFRNDLSCVGCGAQSNCIHSPTYSLFTITRSVTPQKWPSKCNIAASIRRGDKWVFSPARSLSWRRRERPRRPRGHGNGKWDCLDCAGIPR